MSDQESEIGRPADKVEHWCRECGEPMSEPGYVHDQCERVEACP